MRTFKDIWIKVLSLGVGMAVGIVLIAKVFFEISYDSFYKDIDRVYRIYTRYSQKGEEHDYYQVSGAVPVGFMQEVPGVESGTRTTFVFEDKTYLDKDGNKLSGTLVCADTCFFEVFDRPILAGDPVKALDKWGTVMVSRSFAEKMGGIQECIGKQIANNSLPDVNLTIEGVFEDFPRNGTLSYDILLSMSTFSKESTGNWLGNDRYKGYVRLMPGVDPHTLSDAIRKMQEAHQPLEQIEAQGTSLRYYLKPFDKLHTSDTEVHQQIVLLSIVAALLIIISLMNYILIIISSMVKRSKEVGIRKCYGAEAKHIYGMLAKEATLHIVLSSALSAILIFAGRSIVENLVGVPFTTLLVPQSIIAIVILILFVLFISIVVPAQLYQRIPIYTALKNYTENSRNWKLGLLGIQVLINIFLVVMTLVINGQYKIVSHSNTGYNYDNLYYISMFNRDRQEKQRVVEALANLPEVAGVASCYNLPFEGSNGDNILLPDDERELFNVADQYECTNEFYDLLDIQFLEGRAPRDSSEIVVDEKFVTKMAEFTDWSDGAVGKQIHITGHNNGHNSKFGPAFTISGVYKSYIIGNLLDLDMRPSVLFYGDVSSANSYMPHILFRVKDGALQEVKEVLTDVLNGKEVDIISYEEQIRAAYDNSKKMRNTLVLGVVFSLLIALLGLVGFIRDESLRRSKEMAVRKINGASTCNIISIFAKDIMKLSLFMAIIACIGAFFVADKWLEQFAEKITLSPLYFAAGVLVVIAIVIGVLILNCLKIANEDPVKSLKNE